MKNIYYFIGILLAFMSCSGEEFIDTSSKEEVEVTTRVYGGDGEDDVLGYSCDVADDYLYSKLPVIDNQKANEKFPMAVIKNLGQSGSYVYNSGTTAYNYLKSIAENKEVKVKAKFFATASSTISSYYKETSSLSSSHSYASFERTIKKREYTYSIGVVQLRECLSSNFTYDLNNNFNPQTIIAKYGTHIYTNIKVGGKITVLYRADVISTSSETEKKNTVTAGLSGSIGKIFGGSIETTVSKEEIQKALLKISNAQFVINAIGGNASIPMMGMVIDAQNNNYSVNIQEWEKSVTDGSTTTLIDFNPGTLIPIWELVADANKRRTLQTAVENYIIDKALSDRVILYEYIIPHTGNYLCSVHTDELDLAGYKRIGSYGYVYRYQHEGTIPLYAYKSPRNNDHTYSLERNDQHYANEGYYYNGIECYVPNKTSNALSDIRPVYYYSRVIDGNLNHYYSTNKTSYYQGAPYQALSYYVYNTYK